MPEFALPDVGEGLTEAEIVTWRVAEGDEVQVNDVLVDIETAKSVVELPSPFAGRVGALLANEGDTVAVGTPILRIDAADVADPADPAPPADEDASEAPKNGVLVGYGPRSEILGSGRRRRRVTRAPRSSEPDVPAPVSVAALAKPPVRKFAKDHGVDVREVTPSDPSGIVSRADVEAHLALRHTNGGSEPAERMTQEKESGRERRVPIAGVRKRTAEAMVQSAFTAPHVTEWVTVDVSATMDLVDRLRGDREFADVKVTPTLIVAKAVCLALRRTPDLHARWNDEAQEIVFPEHVGLGIATATDRGLLVPVVESADTMSLSELGRAIGELVSTGREGKLQPAQMTGGTFTITNVGVFGVDAGTPILNPGQSGILAVGAINRRPWVDEATDAIVPRWVTTLACSFDHRVVDGEQGSRFLADVAALLSDPVRALTF
ncbi:2-oxo acid dehydrogenase subunit E2 [Aeromicrobium phragmitis]|uniref:Dihydrolipoamide acetyltransferase component of pyruvate dehydrogenase complex n=1 Tax=Aeromicrobium phragmitis TaxID=2478914 RepID=A0A3L8PQ96_9ACTN|nr:dihydrolipoamide acetyltransferase family protein [Aeromicrobium phragmitis]RLV57556.1 2-oxo acid dehydrogenase subunit E2 [Aeromicrobium phragmitis]